MKTADLICTLMDLGLPMLAAMFAGYKSAREPGQKRWEYFLLTALAVFLFSVLTFSVLTWIGEHYTYRLDRFAYLFDRFFGQPAFLIGQWMRRWYWLDITARIAYSTMFSAIMILVAAYFLLRPMSEAIEIVRTLSFALLGIPVSILIPISGPAYAIPGFPFSAPNLSSQPIHLIAPPNGFPSLHFTVALLLLHYAFRWNIGRALAFPYLVLVFIATLGTGEHYLLDLLAAVPFSKLVLWLAAQPVRKDSLIRGLGEVRKPPLPATIASRSTLDKRA